MQHNMADDTSPSPAPVEMHPLPPFLPSQARILLLGSFPPPRKRWSMEFFYPNFTNDMWRIFGLLFFNDKDHFVDTEHKRFRRKAIENFLQEQGIAVSDTVAVARRLNGNASDLTLEVVEPLDLVGMLDRLPYCHTLVTTGQKATDTLCAITGATPPPIGQYASLTCHGRSMRLYRMPSTSRAYPKPLAEKAAVYRTIFQDLTIQTY